jgi:single-strand DNA-binding protein
MARTAFSINKVQLMGNLGKDAETRVTTNGTSVTTFGLATVQGIKGQDGNYTNETTWHNIVAFKLSDFITKNLLKGKKFYIEGRISKSKYTDKNGVERYNVDVIADLIIPCSETTNEGSGTAGHSDPDPENNGNTLDDLPF